MTSIACHAGAFIAAPSPKAKVRESNSHGVVASKNVNTPSRVAATNIHPWVANNKRRRSRRSAMAPAGSPIRKTGRVVAACTRATIVGLGARDVISHAAPTFCIQVPMFDATDASQSARNNGCRSGLQAVRVLAD
jgi:hypothetical protein